MIGNAGRRTKLFLGLGTMIILAIAFFSFTAGNGVKSYGRLEDTQAVVYKSQQCGCCGAWADYAESAGMDVQIKNIRDMQEVKEEHEVLQELGSCHTTVIDGYVVEGHIPMEVVDKMLEQSPDFSGIALPGMPQGSPGMPGPKTEEWKVYSFQEEGTSEEFMVV